MLQQTAAAASASRGSTALGAAAAAELGRSATEAGHGRIGNASFCSRRGAGPPYTHRQRTRGCPQRGHRRRSPLPVTPSRGGGEEVRAVAAGGHEEAIE